MTDFSKVFNIYPTEATPEQPEGDAAFEQTKRVNASKFPPGMTINGNELCSRSRY